jgi:hypothetical protein
LSRANKAAIIVLQLRHAVKVTWNGGNFSRHANFIATTIQQFNLHHIYIQDQHWDQKHFIFAFKKLTVEVVELWSVKRKIESGEWFPLHFYLNDLSHIFSYKWFKNQFGFGLLQCELI